MCDVTRAEAEAERAERERGERERAERLAAESSAHRKGRKPRQSEEAQ